MHGGDYGKIAAMSVIEVRDYLAKADDFLDGMKLFSGSAEHRTSMALLAVHSAISYGDALWIGLGQKRTASTNHKNRKSELKDLLSQLKHSDIGGLSHLDKLIGNKTKIAYSANILTEKMAVEMVDHAQKFSTWANKVGVALSIKGWRYDESD